VVSRVQTLVLDMDAVVSGTPKPPSSRPPGSQRPWAGRGFGHGSSGDGTAPASPGLEPPDLHAWGAPVLCGVGYHTCLALLLFSLWSEALTARWFQNQNHVAGDDVLSSRHGHSARQELQVSGSVWVTPSEGEGCDDIARLS
jgi:hypothetical protein